MQVEIPIEYQTDGDVKAARWVPVEVSSVFKMHGYQFGAHRPHDDQGKYALWIVSELSTGHRVTSGVTRTKAVEHAKYLLDGVTKDDVDRSIKAALKYQKKLKLRR